MPVLEMMISGSEDAGISKTVASVLLELTVTILRKEREVTSVVINYVPRNRWFLGEAIAIKECKTIFFLRITVTEGTNTEAQFSEFISSVFARAKEIFGNVHEESYVHIHESKALSWGYGGETQQKRSGSKLPSAAYPGIDILD